MKTLCSLLSSIEYSLLGKKSLLSLSVEDLCYNSENARKNTVFLCLVGAQADGHAFAVQAYEKGVRAFVCERALPLPSDVLQIIVPNSRIALAEMSANFFSHPEKKLKIIGITGTKGKSSVCEMISHVFMQFGKKIASIGTIGIKICDYTEETQNSTPESYVLYKNFAKMVSLGVEYAVMEVSSQAVMQHRVHGLRFDAAVFTNLSRDHIGACEHPDFEHYKACKKEVFRHANIAFINADDVFAWEFSHACTCRVQTYGIEEKADLQAKNIAPFRKNGVFGVSFSCRNSSVPFKLPLPGDFSVYNALAAAAVCRHFGISPAECATALATVSIRGRFETVPTARRSITCIIDYAHNEQSLSSALSALRAYKPNRIICIFGSVGGRTKIRRREMALAAGELADICILTSDNPNFEPPEKIIAEIAEYIPPEKCVCIADRAEAVRYALETAESGDFLLFAGKGHEEYQLINGKKLPFSERELIEKYSELLFSISQK